jgi:KDO2-lipid IV(A) lauroyltransferase
MKIFGTSGPREIRRVTIAAFANYARYWIDSFSLPNLSDQRVEELFSYDGLEHITDALEKGNGAILALPHLGGWEFGGRWLSIRGIPLTVVAERLEPPELFDWFCSLRQSFGMTVVPLGSSAGAEVARALKNGKLVALVADRVLGDGGIAVKFFSGEVMIPAGPATLAIRNKCALLPTAVYSYKDGRHHAVIMPGLDTSRKGALREDVARVTQDLAKSFEDLILRDPCQWHMFSPIFLDAPAKGA